MWQHPKARYLGAARERRGLARRLRKEQLKVPELAVFDGRIVNTITIEQISAAVKAIHARGAEPMAEGVARTVSAMQIFLRLG